MDRRARPCPRAASALHSAFNPTPSRNGKLIAFDASADGPDQARVAIVNRDGTHPRLIPGTAGCFPGSWRPDNVHLTLNCGNGPQPPWHVRLAAAAGVLPGGFSDPEPGAQPLTSPNGRLLAYADGTTIHVVNFSGWRVRTLPTAAGFHGFLAWSPDGTSLLYPGSGKSGLAMLTVPVTGGRPSVAIADLSACGQNCWVTYAPDGKSILYSGSGDQSADVWIADNAGHHVRKLITSADASDANWLP